MLKIHLRLASVLSKLDWSLIDQLTFKKAARVGDDSTARQLQKFIRPHKTQHPTSKTSKETVIHPYFIVKDILGSAITIIALTIPTLKEPYILRDPDNFTPANPLVTPVHIQPE